MTEPCRCRAAGLVDHIAGVVHHISIVARSAQHVVGTGAAIEKIVAAKAYQHVGPSGSRQGIVELRAGEVLKAAQRVDSRCDRVLCRGEREVDGDPSPLAPDKACS